MLLAEKNGQAPEQENDTNDVNGDSSASEMDEDSGDGNFKDICFVVSKLITTEFNSHFQSFEVKTMVPRTKLVIHHNDLASFLPLNQIQPYGVPTRTKYIVQRFDIGSIN